MSAPLRIANCSGFLGDRHSAALEMVEGGPIDVLTGDYLAELTMAILLRQRMRDPSVGYAKSFLSQMESVLGTCLERGIRVVANAGGLNPGGLAGAVADLAERLGLEVRVAAVSGDDLMPQLDTIVGDLAHLDTGELPGGAGLQLVTANAYLGGWGIAAALEHGADVVVTGRVSDASLVTGPAAWHFAWSRGDWDRLAGAVVAGHVIECGAQATGGNYSFFEEVDGLRRPGFPIAEMYEDGSSVITKHPGTGGMVSVGTVTAQLLYEIGPAAYLNPDVIARFDSINLTEAGEDRVRIDGVRGLPPPPTTKVSAAALVGFRNSMTIVLSGLDLEAKADAVLDGLWELTGGREQYDAVDVRLIRTDRPEAASIEQAMAFLEVTVDDRNPELVGRAFSNAVVELALASVPGFTVTTPPGREAPLVRYWPATIPQVASFVRLGADEYVVPPTSGIEGPPVQPGPAAPPDLDPELLASATVDVPIGRLVGARSGDKGGHANLGVWARSDRAYAWLEGYMSVDRLQVLLPDTAGHEIERVVLPNLRAVNFVIRGYLGEGVASSTQWDPQAKTLGEYFRSKVVSIPEALLAG
jgi:hypothetical protein